MYGLSEESLTIVGIILIVVGVAMIGWVFEVLKGNSARHLFMFYPSLKDNLWDGHLWNPSYFVVTVSEQTSRQIEEYISRQKSR